MSDSPLKPRWGQPLTGLIASGAFLLIALITWIIFGSPNGIFKFYEHPIVEFLAMMILVGLWQCIIFGNWPFQNLKPVKRGIVQIILNIVASYVIIYGVFENFLGKLILPLWNVESLVHLSNGKITEELAKEYVGGSITMFVLIGFFTYAFWTILFQKWPFAGKISQPGLGLAEWGITTVVTLFAYGAIIYPFYVGIVLQQPLAAAGLWWKNIDGVNHLYWAVGIWEWAIVYLFMTANIWAGKPWDLAKRQPWRGLFGLIGIFLLAFLTVKLLVAGMNSFWGAVDPAAKDGIKSLSWRYYHTASIAGFTLFPFLAWNHYFDNWPQKFGVVKGWIIRTIGVFALAAIGYYLYYVVSQPLMGLQPELSNHANKPLVWLFWSIIPLLFNDWFMEKVPFYKPADPKAQKK